jgi:hypothetical protein
MICIEAVHHIYHTFIVIYVPFIFNRWITATKRYKQIMMYLTCIYVRPLCYFVCSRMSHRLGPSEKQQLDNHLSDLVVAEQTIRSLSIFKSLSSPSVT